ncbi:hypothetical protein [Halorarius litoreus]|uniref:hypothetical protein n=1 Tax=Halorarius litoreus TaxID=2962676 RepID=UPI0020CE008A|nr:hypothetical protein [Halorarius litoreus]
MAVTRWTYLGLTLLLVGFLTTGVGAATHLHEQQCQAVQFVSVSDVTATNASTDGYSTGSYEDLSVDEQTVFRSALADDGQVLTARDAIDEQVVTYEGDRYLVRIRSDGGCTPWHPTRVVAPLGGGLGLVLVGGALTRGRDPNP